MNTNYNIQTKEPEKLFLTVRQLAERQPSFNESSIRYLIFHSETNGLDKAIKRIGRKVLFDYDKFIQWVEKQ